ncbi:hypothetical protein [Muribaculum intestinale]|uniref:hypothetical protein n=1 Tax=Muribaculum intestinale TaxID=1796646 RepID=UPI0025B6F6B0|nr:hypothetical protein [Muribaculum intestinale]
MLRRDAESQQKFLSVDREAFVLNYGIGLIAALVIVIDRQAELEHPVTHSGIGRRLPASATENIFKGLQYLDHSAQAA